MAHRSGFFDLGRRLAIGIGVDQPIIARCSERHLRLDRPVFVTTTQPRRASTMRAELVGHFEPCMTEIYLHIYARMADYIRTHPYIGST